jgi:hypothetical protein
MRSIEAVPVQVDGNHFRSMTEARFAVALSALGLAWRYEPGLVKVHADPDGSALWYCPDFVLPDLNVHVEVKPTLDVFWTDHNAARKVICFASWPMPILVWCWEEQTGYYMDRGDDLDRLVLMVDVRFERCQACNRTVLVGWTLDGNWDTIGHGCGLPHDEGRAWNRAVALARGWRADA